MLSMLDILTGRNPHRLPEVEKRDPFKPVAGPKVKLTTEELRSGKAVAANKYWAGKRKSDKMPPKCVCPRCKFNSRVVGPTGRMYAYCKACAVVIARRSDEKKKRELLKYGPVKPKRYVNPTCRCCGERMKKYKSRLMCPKERPPTVRQLRAERAQLKLLMRMNNA